MSDRYADDEHLLRLYLAEIAKHPLLTAEEERSLLQKRALGLAAEAELVGDAEPTEARYAELSATVESGRAAGKALIEANLGLVVAIVEKYSGSGFRLLDLIQEGNLGLVHAVDKIDRPRGSSSRPMRRGGYDRPSNGQSPNEVERCALSLGRRPETNQQHLQISARRSSVSVTCSDGMESIQTPTRPNRRERKRADAALVGAARSCARPSQP